MPDFTHPKLIPSELLPCIHEGKVRDTYLPNAGHLLPVATDRISTHNVVHESTVPYKGEVLTMLTIHWLTTELRALPNHLVAFGAAIYDYLPAGFRELFPELHYRAIVVKRLNMHSVEFIFRRFLAGSLFTAYQAGEDPYGLNLPSGLQLMHRFDEPIFTPTDKSEHDDPLNARETEDRYPIATSRTLSAFLRGERVLSKQDISLVDAKFEAGVCLETGKVRLADEVLTPDSSRFTTKSKIVVGTEPQWLDKEPCRKEAAKQWQTGEKVPLVFPEEVISQTMVRYLTMLERTTGRSLLEWRAFLD